MTSTVANHSRNERPRRIPRWQRGSSPYAPPSIECAHPYVSLSKAAALIRSTWPMVPVRWSEQVHTKRGNCHILFPLSPFHLQLNHNISYYGRTYSQRI